MLYDHVDRHLAEAGSIERAAVPLGMYLAWCANLQLVSHQLVDEAERLLLRVRYREVTGSELLISGCAGALDGIWLNDEGRRFTDGYYGRYLEDFAVVFGEDVYSVKDDWGNYDRIAVLLTRRYMENRRPESSKRRRWWRFWK